MAQRKRGPKIDEYAMQMHARTAPPSLWRSIFTWVIGIVIAKVITILACIVLTFIIPDLGSMQLYSRGKVYQEPTYTFTSYASLALGGLLFGVLLYSISMFANTNDKTTFAIGSAVLVAEAVACIFFQEYGLLFGFVMLPLLLMLTALVFELLPKQKANPA
jgi:hypothetical protein